MTICNVAEVRFIRESAMSLITRAGPEIGVASTKAFTTQLAALFLLTLVMAKVRNKRAHGMKAPISTSYATCRWRSTRSLSSNPKSKAGPALRRQTACTFLGRGRHYPIALEGALKLKEISYIHAEAYPAGELKHGPLALVDSEMPVISVAPNDQLLDKLKSNLREVQARGGELYVFADADSEITESEGVARTEAAGTLR